MTDFELISTRIEELPTLPAVVTRVLQVVEDHDSGISDLVEIIQNDHAIASKVVKVANSAYYGMSQKVGSISHATALLGLETVRNLCLGVGVFRSFLPYQLHLRLDLESFWEHCIATGVCVEMLWTDLKLPDPESVFLSGLIHDIGRLAFLAVGPERYARLMAKARVKRLLLVDAEREEFGGTHAQLGGLLCERWNFPSEVIGPVRHHHTPDEADEATALSTAAVTLGNCLSQKRRVGWAADSSPPEVPGTVIERLGLKPAHLEGLGSRLEGRRAEIESFTRAFM